MPILKRGDMSMKKIIFVVDDDPDITHSVKWVMEYLSPDKYVVVCIENANKCLELLQANQIPDIILLDIMMPGMSGWMLSDRLRENQYWKNIPIIFLTARRDEFAQEAGKPLSKDYITKPFDIHDLKTRIEKVLKESILNAQCLNQYCS
jgi:putative two-component system response regulator